jgi:hypothetical protein
VCSWAQLPPPLCYGFGQVLESSCDSVSSSVKPDHCAHFASFCENVCIKGSAWCLSLLNSIVTGTGYQIGPPGGGNIQAEAFFVAVRVELRASCMPSKCSTI